VILVIDPNEDTTSFWASSQSDQPGTNRVTVPMRENAKVREIAERWLAHEDRFSIFIEGQALKDMVTHMEKYGWRYPAGESPPDRRIVMNCASYSHGVMNTITYEPITDEDFDILARFATVFEQSYTRFLDLKKAEDQAREAQIEAALERVRAKAMTMHKSDELAEAAELLYQELKALGITPWICGYVFLDEETGLGSVWSTEPDGSLFWGLLSVPHTENPVLQQRYASWKRKEALLRVELEGEANVNHHLYLARYTPLTEEETLAVIPERTVCYTANFSHGYLYVLSTESMAVEEEQTLVRFAKVFEMTYRRFLDLQQADARAREAVQQASLDRVRGEIASMRTTDDLQRITPLIWRELTTLGVPFFRCGVFIMDEATEHTHAYLTTPQGQPLAALHLPFDSSPLVQESVKHWHLQQVYTDQWDQQQFLAWTQSMLEQGQIETSETYQGGEEPPESLALQFVPFMQGMLYVGSTAPLPQDQVDLVQALADAFAVAYARYEDFKQLEAAMADLKATQAQLIQQEKMASLGQLTAGIAHEIKNPLNFVNNFAEVNEELADEVLEALDEGDTNEARALLEDLKQNAQVITQHGKRADGIVHAMMQHASGGTGQRETVDINLLVSEHIELAYHGKRAQVPGLQVEIERDLDAEAGVVDVVPQEIGRVLLNLLGNAFDAVHEHALSINGQYEPTVTVSTRQFKGQLEIRVSDNGPGIPEDIKDRIFEPFFTTKPTGTGTGLGLSLSYDIVTQGHGGRLTVESTEGEGATFVITLPVHSPNTG